MAVTITTNGTDAGLDNGTDEGIDQGDVGITTRSRYSGGLDRALRAESRHGEPYLQPLNPNADYYERGPGNRQAPEGCCHPRTASAIAYFGAAIWFFFGFNVPIEVVIKRPVVGNLLPEALWNFYSEVVVVPLVMWGVHYARRFAEVLFLHDYRRRMGCFDTCGVQVYYWGFGIWVGLSMNFHLGYLGPHPMFLYPGLILFTIGEIGNCAAHVSLKRLRQKPRTKQQMSSSKRVMPTGAMFKYVSCPNYTFEIISWIGFAFVSFTLASFVFLLASIITLTIYSYKHHTSYRAEFDGTNDKPLYPTNRKALIPFIF